MKNIKSLYILLIPLLALSYQQLMAQTVDKNYITTYVPLNKYSDESVIPSLGASQCKKTVSYYDGLGRPDQTNVYKGSGDGTKDIITSIGYDDFGREAKQYLPFALAESGGYHDSPTNPSNWNAYYGATDDDFAYSQRVYEPSPLNRVDKLAAPGNSWKKNSGHEVKMGYGTNTGTEVRNFTESNVTSGTTASYYPANSLYKTTTWDENNARSTSTSRTEEFKDKLGRVVLKRVWKSSQSHSTYYVYNDFGLLKYVLPPLVTTEDGKVSAPELSGLCYQYKYDERKRLTEKKLPGTDWIYMAYDSRDRLRATQNGNQRLSNKWEFIKYDELNRPVMTGIYIANVGGQSSMQYLVNMFVLNETRTTSSYGYTFNSFPNSSFSSYYGHTIDVQTVTYYDDYNYQTFWPGSSVFNSYQTVYSEQAKSTKVKGQVTGVRTKVLETSTWLYTVNYYDKYGRLLQQYQSNPDGGYNRTSTAYNFTNQPIKQQVYHKKTSGATAKTTEEKYSYDHMGRPTKVEHRYNGGGFVTIAKNTYDEIGRLQKKEFHNGYQDMNYSYNVRGWLTQINNPYVSVTTDKQFAMKLFYEADMTSTLSGGAQFNGNINGQFWRKADGTKKGYNYTYDGLNRLKNADYGTYSGSWSNTPGRYDMSITLYDKNGNIRNLTRKNSSGGTKESLTYTYAGNQLSSLSGTYNGVGISGKTFAYDANGNAKTDNLRGITVQYFDEIDLPKKYSKVVGSSTYYVQYEYDAAGIKWSKKAVTGGTSTMEYYGSFIYQGGTLDRVLTSEGYYIPANGSVPAKYYYYLKDHLGSTRMVVSYASTGSTPTVEQETEYYPFGSMFTTGNEGINKYLYNGKELQNEFFENYDYGARFYDPALGRFMRQDRFSEKYYSLTNYQYAANNPILFIDINGDSIDVSGLTEGQLETYNSNLEFLMKSEIFAAYFNALSESEKVYTISAQKGEKGTPSEAGQFFNPKTNEVGFGEGMNAYVMAQEFFHAYQSDGSFYSEDKPKPLSTIETEGDIATIYVMTETGLGFPSYGSWSQDFQFDAFDGAPSLERVQSVPYQQMFQTAVDNRIKYYKSSGMNVPTYTSPNRGVRPKALEGVIRLIK
nr:DUF6443 domain-containing protein [uncultured Draconibacterium sp.]